MDTLLNLLEDVISSEETISLFTGRSQDGRKYTQQTDNNEYQPFNTCMYCQGNHKSSACTVYKTPQERAHHLREHNLCMICASPKHTTNQCKKRVCFVCQGAHHTSCCFKSASEQRPPAPTQGQSTPQRMTRSQPQRSISKTSFKHKPVTKVNQVYTEDDLEEISLIRGTQSSETVDQSQELLTDTTICELQSAPRDRKSECTFLPTGEVTVFNPATKSLEKIAVLLDTGAELSFIESSLADKLELPTLETTKLRLHTFGSNDVQEETSRRVQLDSWDKDGRPLRLFLHTHTILTKSLASPPIFKEDVDYIESLKIPFRVSKRETQIKPLILLGCDQVWTLLEEGQSHIRLPSGLHLLPTRIGQLITGQPRVSKPTTTTSHMLALSNKWENCWALDANVSTVHHTSEQNEEEELWAKYWELDSAGTEKFSESEEKVQQAIDQRVWDRFKETVEKRDDGYYVRLPWKEGSLSLPDNRAIAYRRLVSTWSSLCKDKGLLDQYNEVFHDQLKQNIIEVVDEKEQTSVNRVHYIPHQAVLTPHKNTTKLRIVFDASAHYRNSNSLNDTLHRGPVILPSLHGLLLRFRVGRIAMIADVEKAFLQVHLQEIDRDATRFLWLRNHNEPPSQDNIRVYRFTRVTFGLLSSPFLLAATICFHLDQSQGNEGLVKSIKENLYVDNLILTADRLDEAVEKYRRTKEIFEELHMNLREYVSNHSELTAIMADKDKSADVSPKVLGIVWNSEADNILITCKVPVYAKTTKRTVASTIASIYDPMGWMAPLVHKAKIFLQSLWKSPRDWDTPLTEDECEKWQQLREGISGFHKSVPRVLTPKLSRVSLVTFADASSEAMAACIYLKTGDITHLLMAKTKLPSINTKITIPKLELNAMTLAMRLTNSVITQLQTVVTIDGVVVLTDSEIVLNWIKARVRHDAGPFIKNRVNEIQQIAIKLKNSSYHIMFGHISSQYNPADCATRGLSKNELVDHFWWTGPEFVRVPTPNWEDFVKAIIVETTFDNEEYEFDPIQPLGVNTTSKADGMNPDFFRSIRVQTLSNVRRVVAYVIRFVSILASRVRSKHESTDKLFLGLSVCFRSTEERDRKGPLKGQEIAVASKMLVRQHQTASITPETLKALHHLNLSKDEWGIWRCFGRLGNSALDDEAKYPILVLQKSWLSKLIIEDYHSKGHPTTNHTMAQIRQHYWIPKLRSQVTGAIRRCVQCQRYNNLPFKYPEQGDLPSRRVLRSRPFNHVGLDYFGPLSIKREDGSVGKCYGCIITCLVTRLIHLDIAQDLSTYAFIQVLRRFFARRGIPASITSDNAPTFTLGDAVLQDYRRNVQNDPTVAKIVSNNEIQWKYITPFAPWQGGVYERLIRSVKLALFKFQGRSLLPTEDLSTVLIEIEAMLNTRPLVYAESGPQENRILRPIDFLQNNFEIPFPLKSSTENHKDPSFSSSEERVKLQSKLQVMEALKSSCEMPEKFWHIWQTEYLTSLRERHQREVGKQRGSSYIPKVGKTVLICDALQPRHSWKMGRIETLVRNSKGIVREAVVLLPSHRKIRRPLNLLVPLEIDDEFPDESPPDRADRVNDTEKGTDEFNALKEDSQTENNYRERATSRYNLRPKERVNYSENFVGTVQAISQSYALRTTLNVSVDILNSSFLTTEPIPKRASVENAKRLEILDDRTSFTKRVSWLAAAKTFDFTGSQKSAHKTQVKADQLFELTSIASRVQGLPFFEYGDNSTRSNQLASWTIAAIREPACFLDFSSVLHDDCLMTSQTLRHPQQPFRVFCSLNSRGISYRTTIGNNSEWTGRPLLGPSTILSLRNFEFANGRSSDTDLNLQFVTSVLLYFRLASKEEDGDFQLLADLTRMRDMDHKEMQMKIDGTALALHRQKKVAATLITQWNHHKNEDTFICASAGEQMLLTSHLLRQAEVTKEKLLRMGTRYLAMEGCYEDMTKWGDFDRQDWLNREREYAFGPDAILELVTNQCEMLTIEIKDMSVMLERQEKELKESDHLTSSQVQRILRKEIESLQCSFQLRSDLDALKEKVDAQRAEIDSLKECTRNEEDSVATSLEEIDEVGETRDRDTVMTEEREDEERHVEMEDEEDDDERYWRKMVREVNYESSGDVRSSPWCHWKLLFPPEEPS